MAMKAAGQFKRINGSAIVCLHCAGHVRFSDATRVVCFRCIYCKEWSCLSRAVSMIRHEVIENPSKYASIIKDGDI